MPTVFINSYKYATAASGGTPGSTTNDFSTYAGGANLGGQPNWTALLGNLAISSNGGTRGVVKAAGAGTNAVVYWSALAGTGDQYAEIFIRNVNGTTINPFGLAICCDSVGGGNAYTLIHTGGTIYIDKIIAGVSSGVTSFGMSMAVDEGLRFEKVGTGSSTRLYVYKGVPGFYPIAGPLDPGGPYLTGGSPGLASYDASASSADMGSFAAVVA